MNPKDIDVKNSRSYIDLYHAIDYHNLSRFKTLLRAYKAKPNGLLKRAIERKCSIAFIGLLISHGADINELDSDGYSPLWKAVRYEQLDIAARLLLNNADANITQEGESLLIYTVRQRKPVAFIDLLLHYGANPNVKDSDTRNKNYQGDSALYYAVSGGAKRCVIERLLEGGAEVERRILARAEGCSKQVSALLCKASKGRQETCGCCGTESPKIGMAHCSHKATHFFCAECIQLQAEYEIEHNRYELTCITRACVTSPPCDAPLERLGKVLKPHIQKRLDALKTKVSAQSNLEPSERLAECPFCTFYARCPTAEVQPTLVCQNPECAEASCRLCNYLVHSGKSCETAKAERVQSPAHRIAEAQSEAVIRKCPGPGCGASIVKEGDDCNEMAECTLCATVMCYRCGKDISVERTKHFSLSNCKRYNEQNFDESKAVAG